MRSVFNVSFGGRAGWLSMSISGIRGRVGLRGSGGRRQVEMQRIEDIRGDRDRVRRRWHCRANSGCWILNFLLWDWTFDGWRGRGFWRLRDNFHGRTGFLDGTLGTTLRFPSLPLPLLEMRESIDPEQGHWAVVFAPVMRVKVDPDVAIEVAERGRRVERLRTNASAHNPRGWARHANARA